MLVDALVMLCEHHRVNVTFIPCAKAVLPWALESPICGMRDPTSQYISV